MGHNSREHAEGAGRAGRSAYLCNVKQKILLAQASRPARGGRRTRPKGALRRPCNPKRMTKMSLSISHPQPLSKGEERKGGRILGEQFLTNLTSLTNDFEREDEERKRGL